MADITSDISGPDPASEAAHVAYEERLLNHREIDGFAPITENEELLYKMLQSSQ